MKGAEIFLRFRRVEEVKFVYYVLLFFVGETEPNVPALVMQSPLFNLELKIVFSRQRKMCLHCTRRKTAIFIPG